MCIRDRIGGAAAAGLPVDDLVRRPVPVVRAVDGVDAAADDAAGDRQLEGRLHAVGRPAGVLGAFEGLLEGLQVALVLDLGVAAGQLLRVEHGQRQRLEACLDPGVEAGASAGRGLRGAGHGAGQLLGEGVRVLGQAEQLGGGQRGGQPDLGDARAGAQQLSGEGVEVAVPGGDGAGLLRGEAGGGGPPRRVGAVRPVRARGGLGGRRLVRDGGAVGGPGLPVARVVVREGVVLGEEFLVVGRGRPVRVVVGVRVVHGGGRAVGAGGEGVEVGEDGFGGRAAAGEGGVVQGQGPHLVVGGPVQRGVLLVLGGLVGPRLDLAVSGCAVLVEGLEEGGRAAGPLLAGTPPVAGTEQQGLGAGEGDVAEAELLGVLMLLHGLVEGLQAPGVPGDDVGQGVRVTPQSVRQHLALGGPLLAALGAGEGAGDQSGDGDDVPFEALGLVRGQHLDGVLAAGQGVVEALFVLGGGAQEAEEGEQGGLVVPGGEGGGDVEEVGQGFAPPGGKRVRGGRQFDLEARDGEDPVQDVHEGVGQGAPQVAQFGGQACEAHARLGGEGQAVVVPAAVERCLQEGVEGVGERDHLGRVDALDGLGEPPVGVVVAVHARVGDEPPRAAAQQGEVTGADAPARAGEEADEGGVGARVLEDFADGDEVGDLGQVQQPGQADHLDGDVPCHQGGLDRGEVAGRAAQYGDLAGRLAGADEVGDGVGDPVELLRVGGQQGAADGAVAFGARGRAEGLDALVQGAQGGGEAVGEVQQAAAAAAVLAERLAGGGAAVGVGEVVGEVVEVGDGGPAPAVDRLAGVADGGDRVAGAAAEQSGQHDPLGDGGVLVLVEEDHAELVAQHPAHLGDGGEPGGQGDLVAEVEQVALAFGSPVTQHQLGEFAPRGGRFGDLAQVGVGEPGVLQGAQQPGVVGAQVLGAYEVFGELRVEGEEVADQVGEGAGERRVGAGGLAQHACGELVAGGVGEQAGTRFQPDAQPVVAQQPAREGVVRGDHRLARRVDGVGVGDTGLDQRLADAFGEFSGCLVGEGEAEDLFGGDLSGADQPHHARRHHRRLARSGSGHDHLRGGRRDDAGRLLRGERDAEELLELLGIGDTRGHTQNLAADTDSDGPRQPEGGKNRRSARVVRCVTPVTRRRVRPRAGRCTRSGRRSGRSAGPPWA